MNAAFGLSVTLINIAVIVLLASSYWYHRVKLKILEANDDDIDFEGLETKYNKDELSFKVVIKQAIYLILAKLAVKFHFWMFYISGFLLAANTLAFVTSIFGFYIYKVDNPEAILFGRLSDRYLMLLGYIGISILGRSLFTRVHQIKQVSE